MKTALVAINSKYIHSSLALRYIKNSCADFDTEIYEYTINDRISNVVAHLFETGCDLFAFSCYIWNIEFVLKVCSALKQVLDCRILLGGPEVSFDAKNIMQEHNYIDYIILGEGEKPIFEFLAGKDIKKIKGLCYRENKNIKENPVNTVECKLDALPRPYNKAALEKLEGKIIYYEISRGCPYNCSYCLSCVAKTVRYLPLDRVFEDLMLFIENNVPLIKFCDRTFNVDSKRSVEILRFILKNNKNTCFHFEISADILTDELIEIMESAPKGFFQIEAGVQSVNSKTLAAVNRRMNFDLLCKNIKRLRNSNVHVHLDLIAGLPYEDYISFKDSFNKVFKLYPHTLQLGFLKLLKGTPIREMADKFGYCFQGFPPYEVLCNHFISYGEILALKRIEDCLEKYYNSGVFENSLICATKEFNSPFDFFEQFSLYINSKVGTRALGRVELYKLFYDFYNSNGEDIKFTELLKLDFLLNNKGLRLPGFFTCRGDRDFYRHYSEKIKRNPSFYGISPDAKQTNMYNDLRIERFEIDVLGDLSKGEFILLIDYTKKSAKKIL